MTGLHSYATSSESRKRGHPTAIEFESLRAPDRALIRVDCLPHQPENNAIIVALH